VLKAASRPLRPQRLAHEGRRDEHPAAGKVEQGIEEEAQPAKHFRHWRFVCLKNILFLLMAADIYR